MVRPHIQLLHCRLQGPGHRCTLGGQPDLPVTAAAKLLDLTGGLRGSVVETGSGNPQGKAGTCRRASSWAA